MVDKNQHTSGVFLDEAERKEWRHHRYLDVIDDAETWTEAQNMAEQMARPEDRVVEADLVAALRYLEVCLSKFSDEELRRLTSQRAAGLWARGALGASRWRSGKKGAR